jgi:hypothetical protein
LFRLCTLTYRCIDVEKIGKKIKAHHPLRNVPDGFTLKNSGSLRNCFTCLSRKKKSLQSAALLYSIELKGAEIRISYAFSTPLVCFQF